MERTIAETMAPREARGTNLGEAPLIRVPEPAPLAPARLPAPGVGRRLAARFALVAFGLSPSQLDTRLGELTPMGLAWTFMAHSRAYSLIAGIMEMLVVVLLCFRRTALLGALVCVPVMLNVMLMNLCYGSS